MRTLRSALGTSTSLLIRHRTMPRLPLMLASLALGGSLISGCNPLHTTVEITGSLVYGSCGEVLPWNPPFATWTDTGGADGMLRIQSFAGPASSADDVVTFIIDDPEALHGTLGQPIEVGDRYHAGTRASGSITLPVRCPEEKALAVQLHGDLIFDELSPKTSGRVVGHFDGVAIDARSGDTIGSSVLIHFDFPRRYQTPWQTFPTDRIK